MTLVALLILVLAAWLGVAEPAPEAPLAPVPRIEKRAGPVQRAPGVRLVYTLDLEGGEDVLSPETTWDLAERAAVVLQARLPGSTAEVDDVPEDADDRRLPRVTVTTVAPLELAEAETVGRTRGLYRMGIEATREDAPTLDDRRERVRAWRGANPGRPLDEYREATPEGEPELAWCRDPFVEPGYEDRLVAMIVEPREAWRFERGAFDSFHVTATAQGDSALGFELAPERRDDFHEFTKIHVGRTIVHVLDDRMVFSARIAGPLRGVGVVAGMRIFDEITPEELVGLLGSTTLDCPLRLIGYEPLPR